MREPLDRKKDGSGFYRRLMVWSLIAGLIWLGAGCESTPGPKKQPKAQNIWVAAMEGNLPVLKAYLSGDRNLLNGRNESGLTPLHLAAWKGHADVVKFLLDQGADPNVVENSGDTPLHYAASWGFVDCARLLLSRGAEVNMRNRDGQTPLSRVSAPKPEIVELLRRHGGVK